MIAEAGYLLNRNLGPAAEIALVEMITDGAVTVEALTEADWQRGGEWSSDTRIYRSASLTRA